MKMQASNADRALIDSVVVKLKQYGDLADQAKNHKINNQNFVNY